MYNSRMWHGQEELKPLPFIAWRKSLWSKGDDKRFIWLNFFNYLTSLTT